MGARRLKTYFPGLSSQQEFLVWILLVQDTQADLEGRGGVEPLPSACLGWPHEHNGHDACGDLGELPTFDQCDITHEMRGDHRRSLVGLLHSKYFDFKVNNGSHTLTSRQILSTVLTPFLNIIVALFICLNSDWYALLYTTLTALGCCEMKSYSAPSMSLAHRWVLYGENHHHFSKRTISHFERKQKVHRAWWRILLQTAERETLVKPSFKLCFHDTWPGLNTAALALPKLWETPKCLEASIACRWPGLVSTRCVGMPASLPQLAQMVTFFMMATMLDPH